VHFNAYAPEKLPYAINRYAFEAQRDFKILNDRLAKQKSMLGDVYTRSKTLAGAALKQLCR
jgi:GST-like protein